MNFLTIVGARPQFIKAAAISNLLRDDHEEVLVHTGQHYDAAMSDIFFKELGIPEPDINLNIGSGNQGAQTGAMLKAIEDVILDRKPEAVIVYGDTNSTLAGALAAAKLHVPIAHIEAGLRSFNRQMPEEINRVITDHLATWLFAPSEVSLTNLEHEGIISGVHIVGDIMLDSVNLFRDRAAAISAYPNCFGYSSDDYYLCTIHRAENTNNRERLFNIFTVLNSLEKEVVMPLHPRTLKAVREFGIAAGNNIRIINPVGYLDMLQLEQNAACILTDSGGIQKEAYYVGTPCITLREETEWVETVAAGWNILCGTNPDKVRNAIMTLSKERPSRPDLYGNGSTAKTIVEILASSGKEV